MIGETFMKNFIKAIEELPWIVKLILCIPMLDIVWTIVRLCRSIVANNTVGIVVAVILFFFAPFVWLIDLICVILKGKIWWFD
jgi:hypothetical protein